MSGHWKNVLSSWIGLRSQEDNYIRYARLVNLGCIPILKRSFRSDLINILAMATETVNGISTRNIVSDDTGLDESRKTYFQDDCAEAVLVKIVRFAVHNVNFCYC